MKNYDTAAAVACLGGVFLDILKGGDAGLSGFEREAVLAGRMTIAAAAALAMEPYSKGLRWKSWTKTGKEGCRMYSTE